VHYDEIVDEGLRALDRARIDRKWLNLGGETQSQNKMNREYIDSLVLETRILGRGLADTGCTLFGQKLPAPIMPAAMISSRVMEKLANSGEWSRVAPEVSKDYIEEFNRGVVDAGSISWLGVDGESQTASKVLGGGGKAVVIVKPIKDKAKALETFRWAEKLGSVAVGMDVDSMFYEKAFDEDEGPSYLGPQTIADLRLYKKATSLPFIVKGVLSARDAKIAKDEVGADALVVSNHGGEVIDYTMPVLMALPEIRKAVGEEMNLFVDGGMRRGSDAFKALALGADGVCFGTLLVLAFAAGGKGGVAEMLRILYQELRRVMSYTGCRTINEIEPGVVRRLA
jgi:4-hydroxymandelate oxidase